MNITPEALAITVQTLVALDDFQFHTYTEKYEKKVLAECKISESTTVDAANLALYHFSMLSMIGCANGIRMQTSAFTNCLKILDMEKEMAQAIKISKDIPHPYES